jgi:FixJ family two-component response regulator
LVLDIHLPGMTGVELWRRLHGRGIALPVIFITGFQDRELRAQAAETSAIAFLAKPFAGRSLLDAIRRAANGHADNDAAEQG